MLVSCCLFDELQSQFGRTGLQSTTGVVSQIVPRLESSPGRRFQRWKRPPLDHFTAQNVRQGTLWAVETSPIWRFSLVVRNPPYPGDVPQRNTKGAPLGNVLPRTLHNFEFLSCLCCLSIYLSIYLSLIPKQFLTLLPKQCPAVGSCGRRN